MTRPSDNPDHQFNENQESISSDDRTSDVDVLPMYLLIPFPLHPIWFSLLFACDRKLHYESHLMSYAPLCNIAMHSMTEQQYNNLYNLMANAISANDNLNHSIAPMTLSTHMKKIFDGSTNIVQIKEDPVNLSEGTNSKETFACVEPDDCVKYWMSDPTLREHAIQYTKQHSLPLMTSIVNGEDINGNYLRQRYGQFFSEYHTGSEFGNCILRCKDHWLDRFDTSMTGNDSFCRCTFQNL